MYYTHHFAHQETLRRACEWLGRFGFHPDARRTESAGPPTLSLLVARNRLAEVELLINAVEHTDPQGWPSFWDEVHAGWAPAGRAPASTEEGRDHPRRGAIGWHPIDEGQALTAAALDEIREAMGH